MLGLLLTLKALIQKYTSGYIKQLWAVFTDLISESDSFDRFWLWEKLARTEIKKCLLKLIIALGADIAACGKKRSQTMGCITCLIRGEDPGAEQQGPGWYNHSTTSPPCSISACTTLPTLLSNSQNSLLVIWQVRGSCQLPFVVNKFPQSSKRVCEDKWDVCIPRPFKTLWWNEV